MKKFEEDRKKYLNRLNELEYAVEFCRELDSGEEERIILDPKNEIELIKANTYLDFASDFSALPDNAILGRIKNTQSENNLFIEYAVLLIQAIRNGKGGKELREELSKMFFSKGKSITEYFAELMFYATVTPFVDDEALAKIMQDKHASELSDELAVLICTAILKEVHGDMIADGLDNLLIFTRHFHNVCTEHTVVKENSAADAIMRRILKNL